MCKEQFMAAHNELVAEYLERHPNATEAEAYDRTADGAYDRMRDRLFDRADYERKRRREDALTRAAYGDTCGDCGVGAGEHAADCPRLAEP